MGSSGALIVLMACKETLHPRQPGNSKAQNSPCDPLASWAILHRCPRREAGAQHSQSPMIAEVGAVMKLSLPCPAPDLK
jgi:hypothetical protein